MVYVFVLSVLPEFSVKPTVSERVSLEVVPEVDDTEAPSEVVEAVYALPETTPVTVIGNAALADGAT